MILSTIFHSLFLNMHHPSLAWGYLEQLVYCDRCILVQDGIDRIVIIHHVLVSIDCGYGYPVVSTRMDNLNHMFGTCQRLFFRLKTFLRVTTKGGGR